jgi:hypothetical protein
MAPCGINITGVSGKPLYVSPTGCRSNITVSGTVTVAPGAPPCPKVSVTITCVCGATTCTTTGSVDANGVLTNASGGHLVNGHWQLVMLASCCCDANVKIEASCPAYAGCTDSLTTLLPCDKCCPEIIIEVGQGPCDPTTGQAPVTFTVKLDLPAGCPPITAWMDYGDGSPVSLSHSFNPPSSTFGWTHNYSSGTWLAQVVIGAPNHCPSKGVPVTVTCPKTDCCPQISTNVSYGPCNAESRSQVTLITTYHVPAGCPDAVIRTDFGQGPLGPQHSITGSGTIMETCFYPSGSYLGNVLVTQPANCPSTPFKVEVACPPDGCCPQISVRTDNGPCKDGASLVTFTVNVTIPLGCPPVSLSIAYDSTHSGAIHTLAASGSFTETYSYGTGTHLAIVNVLVPSGCSLQEVMVAVQCPPPPSCCPEIFTEVSYGECDGSGNAVVTLVTHVTPKPAPCPPAQVQIDYGGGIFGAVHTFSSAGSFTETQTYGAGPHALNVNVLPPLDCKPTQVNFFVPCTDCCPDVSVSPCIPDCEPGPDRTVDFQITVTPKGPPCPPKAISFQMDFGNGSHGQTVTIPAGGPAYTYTETRTYSGADALQDNNAALTVSQPPECAGTYGSVVIPKCCKPKRANLCATLFWLMSWAFTFAVLALLSYLFGSLFSPPVSLNAFYVLAGIGVLILIVFLLYCTKCLCGWVWRLLWRILFGAGLLYAIHAACTIFHWQTVLIGALMILLAFFFLQQWRKKCCVSECNWLKEIVLWFVLNIFALATFLLTSGVTTGCQFVLFTITIWYLTIKITVLGVAAFAVTLLGAYYLKKCK